MTKDLIKIIALSVLLYACGNDQKVVETAPEVVTKSAVITKTANATTTSNTAKEVAEKAVEASKKIAATQPKEVAVAIEEIKEEQIEKSPNKEKSCADIFEEYKKVINHFITTKNEEKLEPLFSWSNDPLFNSCKDSPEYKAKFDEWEEKMNAVEVD